MGLSSFSRKTRRSLSLLLPAIRERHFDTSQGTEELGHMEMISALVYQLTENLCIDDIKKSGFDTYFVDHTAGIYPVSAGGVPFSVLPIASKGDIITDLHEDLAADGAVI